MLCTMEKYLTSQLMLSVVVMLILTCAQATHFRGAYFWWEPSVSEDPHEVSKSTILYVIFELHIFFNLLLIY